MLIALDQAKIAFGSEEVPFGAVIIDSQTGKIISKAHNKVEQLKDPTAHAEILAIRSAAYQIANARLTNVELFVTLEPCAMCAGAISHARLRRLYFGAYDPKGGAVEHGPCLFSQKTTHHQPEIIGGIQQTACADLLKQFFAERR